MLAIGQVDRDPLERFTKAVRAGHVTGPRSPRAGTYNRRPYYQYTCYAQALPVAAKLWPFLGQEKRDRIVAMIERAGRASLFEPRDHEISTRREHLAWAAGFFDGDGCFSGASSRIATITQTDARILRRFQHVVGLGNIYGPYLSGVQDSWSHQPAFQWRTNTFEHTQALAGMLWFMLGSAKKQQAVGTLEGAGYCKRGHFTAGGRGCPTCVAQSWERKRTSGLCRRGHDKMGLRQCTTCKADGGCVREDVLPYAG